MRVIEVISGLGLGGAERALASRLEFAPPDIETHVVVTGDQDSSISTQVSKRAAIHHTTSRVINVIEDLRPNLVLTHNPREALRLLSHPSFPRRHPVVVVAHNEITSEFVSKASLLDTTLPLVNSRATMHIAVSSRAAAGPQCKRSRVTRVCLLGASLNLNSESNVGFWSPNTVHRVLVLSRLSPQKNLIALLKAVELVKHQLRKSHVHCVIAGDGALKPQLIAAANHWQITDLISFPGWVSDSSRILAGAHTLFIPSRHEGGPLSLYEALLAGIRVISTPVGAAPDVLDGDAQSQLLSGFAPSDIAAGLEALANVPPLQEEERLRRQAHFSWLESRKRSEVFYSLCREAVAQACR